MHRIPFCSTELGSDPVPQAGLWPGHHSEHPAHVGLRGVETQVVALTQERAEQA